MPAVKQLPTLDDVLLAFEKSMSRARESTREIAAEDEAVAAGEKTLFVVEALDVDLCVAVGLTTRGDAVTIDFDAPAEVRSRLKFRIAPKPLATDDAE